MKLEPNGFQPSQGESASVVVRRQWNHWMQGLVKLNNLSGFHWGDYSGGIRAKAPRLFMHAYMSCDALIEGDVAHSCAHGNGPHNIKVCILKKDNKTLFEVLKARCLR